MKLPFTHEQFLDVFAAYNRLLWPVPLLLWAGTLAALVAWWRRGPTSSPMLAGLLAIHWAWSGIAYHFAFFRAINPAAVVFAALFVAQSVLFVWRGILVRGLVFGSVRSGSGAMGVALAGYALAYPGIGLLTGLSYPRMPTFGVPCPTSLLTAGLLLSVPRTEARLAAVIPIVWSAIGGSAAFALGIRPDFALPVAGAALLLHVFRPAQRSAAEAGASSPVARVTSQDLVPGALSMDVFQVTIDDATGPVRSVLFVSRGMAAAGQKEIALGVKMRPGEPPGALQAEVGAHLIRFFDLAREGRPVDAGGRTVLSPQSRPLLGRADFRGIVYTVPDALTRALVGANGIIAIVVTGREIEIADHVGHTRLLSQLGDRVRFFPTPFWSDRDRPQVLTEEFRSTSVLNRATRVPAYGATAWVTISPDSRAVAGPTTMPDFEGNLDAMKVDLELDEGSGAILCEALGAVPDTSPLAVLTGVSAEMPRCLTWKPGQQGMSAISDFDRRADPRCAGNFVVFAPDQAENGARVIEDGFGLVLRTDDWRAIRKAILEGRAAQARDSSGRLILEVSWKR